MLAPAGVGDYIARGCFQVISGGSDKTALKLGVVVFLDGKMGRNNLMGDGVRPPPAG
jgi:hypothetical protein